MNAEKKQYIYVLKLINELLDDKNWTEKENNIVRKHFEHLQNLHKEGIVILAGRTLNIDPEAFGIVIFEANSENEAVNIMNSDPAVRDKIMTAKVYPYKIAIM